MRWPWEDDDDILPENEAAELRALRHISHQLSKIIDLLTPTTASPDAVALHAIGVPMPVTIDANQTTVTYTYTESRGGTVITPNVGSAAWSVDDPNALGLTDNGDGSATVTRTGAAAASTNVNVSVTLPDGSVLSAADTVTVDAQAPDAVELVAGTPA